MSFQEVLDGEPRRLGCTARDAVPDAPAAGTGEQPEFAVVSWAAPSDLHPEFTTSRGPLRSGAVQEIEKISRGVTTVEANLLARNRVMEAVGFVGKVATGLRRNHGVRHPARSTWAS